jgi:hypothetical protein
MDKRLKLEWDLVLLVCALGGPFCLSLYDRKVCMPI